MNLATFCDLITDLFALWSCRARKYLTHSQIHACYDVHIRGNTSHILEGGYQEGNLFLCFKDELENVFTLQQTSIAELAKLQSTKALYSNTQPFVLAVFQWFSKLFFTWYKLHMSVLSGDRKVDMAFLCRSLQHEGTMHH